MTLLRPMLDVVEVDGRWLRRQVGVTVWLDPPSAPAAVAGTAVLYADGTGVLYADATPVRYST